MSNEILRDRDLDIVARGWAKIILDAYVLASMSDAASDAEAAILLRVRNMVLPPGDKVYIEAVRRLSAELKAPGGEDNG